MQYRGNPTLAKDLQGRIIKSFEQALEHAKEEKIQEAELGCEFILNMDPLFEPAQMLVERLKSDQRPVHTADLQPDKVGEVTKSMEGLVDLTITDSDLDELEALENLDEFADLTLEEPEPEPAPEAPAQEPPAAPAAATSGLGTVLQDLLERRNFQQILQIAESQQETIAESPELGAMVDRARQAQESEAFVTSFLTAARAAQAAGDRAEANRQLEKAKALDPEHPEVLELGRTLEVPAPEQLEAADSAQSVAAIPEPAAEEEEPVDLGPLDDDSLVFDEDEIGETLPPLDTDFLDDDDEDDPLGTLAMEAIPEDPDPEPPLLPEEEEAPTALLAVDDEDEGEGRIEELLSQGQAAFEQGQFQEAIDTWSRIFLMDLDNQEAQERIEEARTKKAEQERRAEQAFHEGLSHLEADSPEEAAASFRHVLVLNPGHRKAKEFLEQLEAGEVPEFKDLLLAPDPLAALEEPAEPAEASESPSMEEAVARDRIVAVKKTDWRLVAIGAALFLLVAAGGAFLWSKKDELFPNSTPTNATASAGVKRPNPLARAEAMYEGGNTENAINLLRRIQPDDPRHGEAQVLIEEWTAELEAAEEPEAPSGPSEEALARRERFLEGARTAFAEEHHIRALRYLERAAKILPLEQAGLELKRDCEEQLEPLATALEKFEQGEYASILPDLWRAYDKSPQDHDLELLIVDSYYNLALRDLQRGSAELAAEKLAEAMSVLPENVELERLHLFAKAYSEVPQDLLYRIFVKYLPSR